MKAVGQESTETASFHYKEMTMNLNLTQHADKRLRQRGINNTTLEYIYLYLKLVLAAGTLKHARIPKLCDADMPSTKVPHSLILIGPA
jgi:hypothetical protein